MTPFRKGREYKISNLGNFQGINGLTRRRGRVKKNGKMGQRHLWKILYVKLHFVFNLDIDHWIWTVHSFKKFKTPFFSIVFQQIWLIEEFKVFAY